MKFYIEKIEKVFASCQTEGKLKPKESPNIEIIQSLMETAKQGLERIKSYNYQFEKKTNNYAFVLRDHYEIMRMLIDAFLNFDKIDISNHQCSNAYLCTRHPELGFDWEILESMRILRNAINYEGRKISGELWNSHKPKFEIYINSLLKLIKEKLK